MTEQSGTVSEREATFVIVSADPESVASEISGLGSIAKFKLLPGYSKNIVDTYFDTRGRELTANRWALRLRCSESVMLLTLKGPSRPTDWGGQERLEMEAVWSKEALERFVSELDRAGIAALRVAAYYENDPAKTLENCGLGVIQRRELWRRTRLVVLQSSHSAVAEVAIDRVHYRGPSGEVFHWEVELEAQGDAEPTAIPEIIGALLDRFGSVLRPWPHSKLATGFAIEELLKDGVLQGLIGDGARLTPAGYDRLDQHIQGYV